MARNCGEQTDSIQQRISRINHEISKGSAVYTRDELRRLDNDLRDAERTLDYLMTNSGGEPESDGAGYKHIENLS